MVEKLIAQLAKPGTPVLRCYNKADLAVDDAAPTAELTVAISARNGDGTFRSCSGPLRSRP